MGSLESHVKAKLAAALAVLETQLALGITHQVMQAAPTMTQQVQITLATNSIRPHFGRNPRRRLRVRPNWVLPSQEPPPEANLAKRAQVFADQIAAYDPGPLFTKEIADQIANGNLDGVNAALKQKMQGVAQQSLIQSAQLLKMYGEKLQSQMEAMIEAKLGNRDNTSSLGESFTAYKDPAMKPVIDGVFAQAMKLSKGDRTAAIASTREMLKYMGKTGASDMGITIPPGGPGDDYGNSAGAKSLVDELLGR